MSSKVNFSFDSILGVYYAGQVVSGTAELITERPKTIRCKCVLAQDVNNISLWLWMA